MNSSPAPMLRFWILSQVSWISDEEVRRLALANALSSAEVANDYGCPIPNVSIASRIEDVPDEDTPVVLSPRIAQPNFLAWHSVLDGRPFCLVLADKDRVTLRGVQVGANHEIAEAIPDPYCDRWVPINEAGDEIALEDCDGTEGDEYPIDLGSGDPVWMSNHVKPAWFDASSPPGTKLDHMGLVSRPLTVRPNGYSLIRTADGRTRQVGEGPAAYKMHPAHRYGRRLAAMHVHNARRRAEVAADLAELDKKR